MCWLRMLDKALARVQLQPRGNAKIAIAKPCEGNLMSELQFFSLHGVLGLKLGVVHVGGA